MSRHDNEQRLTEGTKLYRLKIGLHFLRSSLVECLSDDSDEFGLELLGSLPLCKTLASVLVRDMGETYDSLGESILLRLQIAISFVEENIIEEVLT